MATDLQAKESRGHETASAVKPLRISRTMYMEMIDAGVVTEDQRIQLVDGELYEMSPSRNPHWIAIHRLLRILEGRLPPGWSYLAQDALVTDEYGEPEPDIAIFRGDVMEMTEKADASQTALVIEVSESSLAFDRGKKLTAYAEAGVPEYWIINLEDRIVEVYTGPQPRDEERRGTYAVRRTLRAEEQVAIRLDGESIVEFRLGDLLIG